MSAKESAGSDKSSHAAALQAPTSPSLPSPVPQPQESDPEPDKIVLQSNDNDLIKVERSVAERSMLIKTMLEVLGQKALGQPVPIPNVTGRILRKVIEWCEHHRNDPPSTDKDGPKIILDISEWDQEFMNIDHEIIFQIILAANYLEIVPLLNIGCKTVANMLKGMSPEDMRKVFRLTPEGGENN